MGHQCCGPENNTDQLRDKAYRRILWIVLIINFVMFLVEVIAGVAAGSVSLQADALDFLSDSANYAISLFVVGMALRRRARSVLRRLFPMPWCLPCSGLTATATAICVRSGSVHAMM